MTGKVIGNSTAGFLILILPLALAMVILYSAWPLLLALTILSIGWKIWQRYQWKQWSQKINPYFNELIKENQGCLTAMDLALKAQMNGKAAQRFLAKKAEEYGAQSKEYEDKGTVYYFLTASALGSIFADSDPAWQLDEEEEETQETESQEVVNSSSSDVDTQEQSSMSNGQVATATVAKLQTAISELLQGELAHRLDVHSSTVGKRKLDKDFPQWSQHRDPEGIAWQYSVQKRVFEPLEAGK